MCRKASRQSKKLLPLSDATKITGASVLFQTVVLMILLSVKLIRISVLIL